jgi:hypothetical protein
MTTESSTFTSGTGGGSRRSIAMVEIPADFVSKLEQFRASRRNRSVMLDLGISDNTWRKIRTGTPIKLTVAQRLLERVGSDIAELHGPDQASAADTCCPERS